MGLPKHPSISPDTDEDWPFGRTTILSDAMGDRDRWLPLVEAMVGRAADVAIRYLGIDGARSLWERFAPKRPVGNKHGTRNRDEDHELIGIFLACRERVPAVAEADIISRIADHLACQGNNRTVEKDRRRIKARLRLVLERRRRAEEAQAEMARKLFGSGGGSLLGNLLDRTNPDD